MRAIVENGRPRPLCSWAHPTPAPVIQSGARGANPHGPSGCARSRPSSAPTPAVARSGRALRPAGAGDGAGTAAGGAPGRRVCLALGPTAKGCAAKFLINTPPQRGVSPARKTPNRFSGFLIHIVEFLLGKNVQHTIKKEEAEPVWTFSEPSIQYFRGNNNKNTTS